MKRSIKTFASLVFVFAITGAFASAMALQAKYSDEASAFCEINETFDCASVNTSQYSEFLGVPVSILGLAAYIFFFVATMAYLKSRSELLMNMMIFGVVLSLLFSFYLTAIEAFVLYAWCIYCIISQISIILVAIGIFGVRSAQNHQKITPKDIHR